jgi:hypothetical protein
VTNYIGWDDARFLMVFGGDEFGGSYCQNIVRRLSERRLLIEVFQDRVSHLPESCRERITEISQVNNRPVRRELERRIAEAMQQAGVELECSLNDPSNLVMAHSFSLKSARAQSRNDEGSIMIHTAPDPTPFEEESNLFRSINEKMNDPHFAVYAPVGPTPGYRAALFHSDTGSMSSSGIQALNMEARRTLGAEQ